LRTVLALSAAAALAACAPAKPVTAPTPARDPRNNLKAGLFDAGEFTSNLKVVAKVASPKGFLGETNSDLAFTGNYVIQGNYNGPVVWDISNPSAPTLVVAYECPASQNDVSVYKNLMFMSAEAMNGRADCKPGGVKEVVSKDRVRGVRIFDITNIREPKLVANVQTCRGSHTHTVLEDPKDKDNVYIYVSGSSGIRPAGELAEWAANAGFTVAVVSEYGITPVRAGIDINRGLRRAGLVRVQEVDLARNRIALTMRLAEKAEPAGRGERQDERQGQTRSLPPQQQPAGQRPQQRSGQDRRAAVAQLRRRERREDAADDG
jgi:hypothetical protein